MTSLALIWDRVFPRIPKSMVNTLLPLLLLPLHLVTPFGECVYSFGTLTLLAGRSHAVETVSELLYVPKNERDFGTLACWAKNSIGKQTEPCLFQVVPAGEHSVCHSKTFPGFSSYLS